jgi:autotransporter-associated beta strand protein
VINVNLGAGTMTNNGDVAVNGSIAAETVNIASGTTTLRAAESLLDTANVTVTGNLLLGGNEKISQLSSSGNVDLSQGNLTVDSGNFSGVLKSNNPDFGLIKVTDGTLALSGANTYTGATQINGGTVDLTGSMASTSVKAELGTTLNNTNAGLADNAALSSDGTVNLGADDNVASLSNTGTINGTGNTLTAATYALNNGSVVNANLGTGVITNNGAVALNGTSSAATVNIASGTTTLGSAERLLDTANVTVSGNMLLGGNEQVGTLSGAGVVDLSQGGLTVDSGNFSGILQSSNANYGLTKNTDGLLTLSGVNTYTGVTQINAGTVNLLGNLASTTINVAAGATLNDPGLSAQATVTNDGTLNVGGNETILALNNTGTVNGSPNTLTAKTYALNNGSIINANLGSGVITTSGDVTLNGTAMASNVIIPLASTLNLGTPANLGNQGSRLINPDVSVNVDGTLNLYGGSEYLQTLLGTGAINLSVNQLFIGNGGAFTGVINGGNTSLNASGGKLTLNNGTTTAQSLVVSNGSTLTLGGNSTFNAQNVSVNAGSTLTLEPDAKLNYVLFNGGDINNPGGFINSLNFVNQAGGTVQGFLTFLGNFNNNGILSPGNSPGLTTITGNYTENATFLAQVQNTTPVSGYDQVRVGGTVTLNPTSKLIMQAWGGGVPAYGNTYQIIADSSGGAKRVSGTFGNVLFDNGTGTQVKNAAMVFDVNTGNAIATGLNAATSTFANIGSTTSQHAAASSVFSVATGSVGPNQIDSSTPVGNTAFALLTANGTAASLNIERMVPEYYSGMADYALMTNKTVSNILFSRPLSFDKTSRTGANSSFFANKSVYAGYVNNRYSEAFSTTRNDFYIGAEAGNDNVSFGALFLGNFGSTRGTYGSGNLSGVGGSLYTRGTLFSKLKLLANVGYSGYSNDLNRSSVTGVTSATANSSGLNAGLGATYLAFDKSGYSIQPRVGLNYGSAWIDGFQENGSNQRLMFASSNASRFSVQAGAIFAKSFNVINRPLKLALDLGGESVFSDRKSNMDATLITDTRVHFPISFNSYNKTYGLVGISANYDIAKYASIYLKFEANSMGNNGVVELKSSF